MILKVITLFLFVTIIQTKSLDEVDNSHHRNEASKETLQLDADLSNSLQDSTQKFDDGQSDALITALEEMQQEMIDILNKEITDLEKLGNSNLKIDKELIKKLIDNTAKLINALVRVGRALFAVVKDLIPI